MPNVRRRTFLSGLSAAVAGASGAKALAQEDGLPGLESVRQQGCSVQSAHFHLGALVVLARDASGGMFQIDVLRRDADGPTGIAETGSLALFLANRGDGSSPTVEEHGLFLMALAEHLQTLDASDSLLSWQERRNEHPSGSFSLG